MSPDEAVVILKGPHADLARAAEHLATHGLASQLLCPDAGSS
jgi:hypothetical protein